MEKVSLRIIENAKELFELRDPWVKLLKQMENPLPACHPDWMEAWWNSLIEKPQMYVMTCWLKNEMIGALPLVRGKMPVMKFGKLSSLEAWVGTDTPGIDLIAAKENVSACLAAIEGHLQSIPNQWDVLFLKRLQTHEKLLVKLCEVFCAPSYELVTNEDQGSYILPIQGNFSEYFDGLSKSFRSNRRNMNNRLEGMGELRLHHFEVSDSPAMKDFYSLEKSGALRNGIKPIKDRPAMKKFYEGLARSFSERGAYHGFILYLDDVPMASLVGLVEAGRFSFLKIGVNYQNGHVVDKTSPGQALLYKVIQWCFDSQEIKEFDFCGPFYEYEKRWTKEKHIKFNVCIFNRKSFKSRLYLCIRGILKIILLRKSKK